MRLYKRNINMFSWYIDSYEHLNNQFPLHQRIQERERVVYIRTLMLENIKNQDIVTVCNFTSFTLEIFKLKLKTIHKCFLCHYKRQSSMLWFIAFRFPRTPVVKRAIGKAKLHKLPIYNEYICLCWVSTLFFMIYCNSCTTYTQLRFLDITFSLRCEHSTFSCSRTLRNDRDLPFIGA